MSETRPIYMTVTTKLLHELIDHIVHGEIRRVRLPNGVGVALAIGGEEQGLLTVSRPVSDNKISEREIKRLLSDFKEVFASLDRPVLLIKELFKELSVDGRYYVIKFTIYFGEQGRLVL